MSVRRLLPGITAILLVWGWTVSAGATHPFVNGIRPPTPEEALYLDGKVQSVRDVVPTREALLRAQERPSRQRTRPDTWTNHQYLPVIGDQGSQGSCAAWASCYYYKTYQEARERGWDRPDPEVNPAQVCSPAFGYNLANRGVDQGSWPLMIMELMTQLGCAPWEDLPYTDEDYTEWPAEAGWRQATYYRAESVGEIDVSTTQGLEDLKQHLANGDLAVLGIDVYNNFFSYPDCAGADHGVFYQDVGGYAGSHAVAIIGYDDDKEYTVGSEEHEGAFLLANSWGTDWGVEEPHLGTRGFFWLSYDYVQHDSFQQAWVMTDRIGYVPTVFAVCGVNHSKRGEVGAGFAGGADPLDPSWSLEWLPFLGGSWYLDQMGFWREAEYPVDQNLVADLSDCGVAPGDTIWLQIEDLAANGHQGSNTVGQIIDLEVEFAGPPPRSSVDVPKTTCNGGTVYVRVGGGGALDDLVVYPNPCYPEKNQSVYFLNLPEIERSSIRLYTVSGELVRELEKTAQWDCTTEDGSPVARGVYLYVVDVGGARRTGKIAIIR